MMKFCPPAWHAAQLALNMLSPFATILFCNYMDVTIPAARKHVRNIRPMKQKSEDQ
jgi:hypothetical protein